MPKGSEEAYGKKGKRSHGASDSDVRDGFSRKPIAARQRPGLHQPEYRKPKGK